MTRECVFRLIFRLQLAALALMAAGLLLRNALAIGWHVPLDPNEGWNAYHALAGLRGLYPPPQSLMVNNYPPLSFPLIAAAGWLTGDAIVAGRIVSLLSFLACACGIAWALRRMGCTLAEAGFGALVFACGVAVGSDYVAMDDPQLLGHALQIGGLILLLRERPAPVWAALLLAAGLFVKHNLLALPLASAVWLFWQDRHAGARFILAGLGFGIAGLVLFRLICDFDLAALASARIYNLANLESVSWRFLQWAGAAIEFSLWLIFRQGRDPPERFQEKCAALPDAAARQLRPEPRPNKFVRFTAIYGGIALAIGLAFSAGDGVDANIFFDAAIALSLTAGLIQRRFGGYGRAVAGMALVVPLALCLVLRFPDDNFAYAADFRSEAPRDIAFLKSGPALCEQLSLCYWAGEKSPVDVFNLGEQIATATRSPAPLVALLNAHHFRSIQFDDMDAFALGPEVRAALLKNYRRDHQDDNGVFFRPR